MDADAIKATETGTTGGDTPHTAAGPSEFGVRTRQLGHLLERLERDHDRQPVTPEHRQMVREWIGAAREHTTDPDAFDLELVNDDRPLDYVMLADIYRQQSDLVRDRD